MRTISEPHVYTPVVTFATTNPTAATITCESQGHMQIGKLHRVHVKATFTAVGTGGVGAVQFSLPTAVAANSASSVVFSALTGVTFPTNGLMIIGKIASNVVKVYGVTAAGVETPVTWAELANGNVIEFIAEYMEA